MQLVFPEYVKKGEALPNVIKLRKFVIPRPVRKLVVGISGEEFSTGDRHTSVSTGSR